MNSTHTDRKKLTFRVDPVTYTHLKQLTKAQHSTINSLLTDLVNGNYHPRKRPNLNRKTVRDMFKSFLAVEQLINRIDNSLIHDSTNLNQIAFKVNTNDFRGQNPSYIATNANLLRQSIESDNKTIKSAKSILNQIRKEMLKIWQLLE